MALETNNLAIGYPSRTILKGINASLEPGEFTVLIGSNGCGKSTLLRTLAGAQQPIEGDVVILGDSIRRLSSAKLSHKLAIVLTDRTGAGGLTLEELVSIGRHPYSGFLGRLSHKDKEIVKNAIESVGLLHKINSFISELSDGERQKAMIARALAQETPVIILDEPTSFLDVASRYDIMNLLANAAHQEGKSILLSTHDTSAAVPLADRLWVVANGTLYTGKTEELSANGTLNRVFSGIEFDTTRLDFRERR